ncbi:TPA: hypothetical protein QCX08_004004 [Bacillus cytotoxicus]|nr:hypothetical protein [Bacillus cytotoxicus]HDR7866126.1 hypothetical protein [Bacillus cytotoxicus]HDR7881816.1 hypothetical protein [Bacillus cytotoxicus]
MVMVETPGSDEKSEEEKKKEEQRKKAAERKRKSRANAKKKASALGDAQQLKILLLTTSQIVAARPGMEMWAMSETEVDQLVTPLYNILSKNEGVGQVMSEYADHIALIVAVFTIFVPKFLMWKAARPKKEVTHYARKSTNSDGTQGQQAGKATTDNRPSRGQSANHDTTFGGQLSELIPSSVGI